MVLNSPTFKTKLKSDKVLLNKGVSRVAISFIIVGLFTFSLLSYAIYKANHPSPLAIYRESNIDLKTVSASQINLVPTSSIPSTTSKTPVTNATNTQDKTTPPVNKPEVITPAVDPTTKRTSKYKDGVYTAIGSYNSPGGMDEIGVSLNLKDDIVTRVSATNMSNDNTSSRYQEMFLSGYQSLVIGKDISTLSLGKVSGSSLTSVGFNDALAQIKSQAKV